uniref:UPAR/Ly6 domain-containing protein n=2 Tax=Pyxicephalus adspersus TaxID=30357 RepID=A0AAV3AIW7_PYXAD|nr:TPA: hypothetical protein GDO54_011612 [Pyxicephalus adspersus]
MAAYTSVLVLLALCVASAHALKCYTCDNEDNENKCKKTATCPADQTFCRAVVIEIGNFSYITKDCASMCKNSLIDGDAEASGLTFCCTTDLCNVSGAPSMQAMYTILAVALFFLGALLIQSK